MWRHDNIPYRENEFGWIMSIYMWHLQTNEVYPEIKFVAKTSIKLFLECISKVSINYKLQCDLAGCLAE